MPNPSADFPAAIHTDTDISGFGGTALGATTPTHTALEGKQEEELKAVQTKVGTGSSTPTATTVLAGTGVGTSAWTAPTGTGTPVYSNSPTLVAPALGTPASGVATNLTGTASGLTSGITNALASATTTVNVSSATAPTANQVLTATSGTAATWQTPSGGGGGLSYSSVAGTTQAAAINTGYVISNASLTTVTLPSVAALGSVVAIAGLGAAGWLLAQNSGQLVHVSGRVSTTGVGGSVASTNANDCIYLVCTVANTTWTAQNFVGNLTVV